MSSHFINLLFLIDTNRQKLLYIHSPISERSESDRIRLSYVGLAICCHKPEALSNMCTGESVSVSLFISFIEENNDPHMYVEGNIVNKNISTALAFLNQA